MRRLLVQLKALADESRLKIFKLVQSRELCVCQIVAATGLAQPTVSVHLGKLKQAGLVSDRRDGQWSYYKADPESEEAFRKGLEAFLAADATSLPEVAGLLARARCTPAGPYPAVAKSQEE